MTIWVLMVLCISTNGDNRNTMMDANLFETKERCDRNLEGNKKEFEARCEQLSIECKQREINKGK